MNINFFPKSKETEVLVSKPIPAKNYIPTWIKNLDAFTNNNNVVIDDNGFANATAKMCKPFMDSFNMGYIQETWCDIIIEKDKDDNIRWNWSIKPQIMEARRSGIKIPNDYYSIEFAWKNQWIPQLPTGYSILYTHPLNHYDLPFYSFSGVVDSDKYKYEVEGNHPFLIKKGFSGIIPKGTPMYQIIPFKRDDWKSNYLDFNEKDQLKAFLVRKNFWGFYKNNFWSKKKFE